MSSIAGLDVSRETLERLKAYEALLNKWNPAINLVAKSTIKNAWQRHFEDSAQVYALAPKVLHWADLGSGGGFPGLVVAILAEEQSPGLRLTLVESDRRKATFLQTVMRELDVQAKVLPQRIEAVDPLQAGVISARALAPLDALLSHAARHLAPGGHALFLKGANHQAEIEAARENWHFSVEISPSQTDSAAVALKIGDLTRA